MKIGRRMIVLCTCVILILFILIAPQYNKADIEESNETSHPNPSEKIYADILDLFYHHIQTDWAECYEEPYEGKFSFLFFKNFSDPSYADKIGYAFMDLNGDGTDELLIGIDITEDSIEKDMYQDVIFDLYTYMDNRIIHLATSGERFAYGLCEDHTIYYYGAGGAFYSYYYHYELDPNKPVLSVLESIRMEEDCWSYSSSGQYDPETNSHEGEMLTDISRDDACSVMDSWPQWIGFPLKYFSEYTPSERDS